MRLTDLIVSTAIPDDCESLNKTEVAESIKGVRVCRDKRVWDRE